MIRTSGSMLDWFTRAGGVAVGVGTQLVFAATVYRLYFFLEDRMGDIAPHAIAADIALALQFAIPHSLLLLPSVRRTITRIVPRAFYGTLFCLATCASLWLIFVGWRATATVIWDFNGWPAVLMRAGFLASWVALLYSISLTGFGYQTGWTDWWHWFRRRPLPRREFAEHGAYRVLRHPIYLSFLGLIWFAPRMTLDHAVLTCLWTAYIFFGSMLKDQRLKFYLGETYVRYASRVPGYPALSWSVLGRWPVNVPPAPSTAKRAA